MDKFEIRKLRDLPIEGVAERLGLRINRSHKSLCPFHDDHTASLSFHVRRNTCRCFVCMDRSMGTIDLVMKHLGLGFRDACRWLANENNIIISDNPQSLHNDRHSRNEYTFDASRYARYFEHPWLSEAARRFLFEERRLNHAVVSWCRLTSWRDKGGVNWLQTPYYDVDGKLIGVQNRNLDGPCPREDGTPTQPRFRFPAGSRCSIYNLPILKMLRPGDDLYITEGCSDCWAMLSSGHKAIAIPSATLLSTRDKEQLSSLSSSLSLKWHMYPDNDIPGERLFLQLKDILPTLQHHHLPPGCKDFSDCYMKRILSVNLK